MNEKQQTKKEITMDDLALMVAKGFNDVDEKMASGFKSVNERLDKVEIKLDTIEANLNKKVDKVDHNTLTYRVEKLEKKFA